MTALRQKRADMETDRTKEKTALGSAISTELRIRPSRYFDEASAFDIAHHQLALSWRAAASAVSSGRVLNAIVALGAALWTALTTISNRGRLFGGILRPPPITTQSSAA